MKNLLLILALTITSGVLYSQSKKELVYYVDGECYPTTEYIQNMVTKSEVTGIEYVWFTPNCEWMSRSDRDSLVNVLQEKVWKETLESYPKEDTSLEKSNKISDLERTISSLNTTISSLNTNVSKLTTELQKSKAEKEYEIGNLQSQLKSKMDSLQLINTELSRYKNANQVVYIPDANFKKYLIGNEDINTNGDNEIQLSEATSFEGDMECSKMNISNLNGVEAFTALTGLDCGDNYLTSLDVSKNTALTSLYCHSNQLTSLDVSKNTALTDLDCGHNQLTSLDVSKNTALTELGCHINQLTSLDVSKNTALTGLDCYSNQLTSLDVSKNTALTGLDCHINQLASLDVSKNTALTYLMCSGNSFNCDALKKSRGLE